MIFGIGYASSCRDGLSRVPAMPCVVLPISSGRQTLRGPPHAVHRPLTHRRPSEVDDRQALERYRYMLRTAPPDDIERAHEEAFAQLSPDHRAAVLRQLSEQVP